MERGEGHADAGGHPIVAGVGLDTHEYLHPKALKHRNEETFLHF